jgi:gliding motility-associated-like protein
MKQSLTILKSLLFILFCNNLLAQPCRQADSLALVSLYNTTNGVNWTNKWDLTKPIDTWFGIQLNAKGCVECIDLDGVADCALSSQTGNNLVGTLPNFSFTELRILILASNQLTGVIPNFTLPKLEVLILQANQLSGVVPNFNLPNLERLVLSTNQLMGNLPNFNLPNLTELAAVNNLLMGSIPNFNMPNLRSLQLGNNQLNGAIPNFAMPSLQRLNLAGNQLSGSIPNFNMPILQTMSLFDNQLTGLIPNFDLPLLTNLFLDNNRLSGGIPNFNTPRLRNLNVSSNRLDGKIEILKQNIVFYSQDNRFTFEDLLPAITRIIDKTYDPQDSVFKDTALNALAGASFNIDLIVDAAVADNEYQWYKNGLPFGSPLVGTNKLVFNNIQVTDAGVYTCYITNPQLPLLKLVSRRVVLQVENPCRKLDSLALVTFFNATNGPNWTIPWDLKKPLNTWRGVRIGALGCVDSLDLQGNNLVGNFPASIGDITNLEYISIGLNPLTGPIPTTIKNLPNLRVFQVFKANLSGAIPIELWNLSRLERVNLSENQLKGSISPQIANLPNLKILYLDNNQLIGSIPTEIGGLTKLEVINLSSNNLVGIVPPMLSQLSNLVSLELQKNQLSGEIPATFGNLKKMTILDVRDNNLDSMPTLLGAEKLQILMMDNNKLTFDDIAPNMPILLRGGTFSYANQKPFFKDTTIVVQFGKSININLGIDGALSNSTYKWFKNNTAFDSLKLNAYNFINISPCDESIYTVQVTNTNVPFLTLQSRKITLKVDGNPATIIKNKTICSGQSYVLPLGRAVKMTGIYRDTFKTLRGGCFVDSLVVITNLDVSIPIKTTHNREICKGKTYILPDGKAVNTEGVYPITLKTPDGCDSLAEINLKFAPVLKQTINAVVCKGKTYILPDGKAVNTEGVYPFALKTPDGCDSLAEINLKFALVLKQTINAVVCKGKIYILPDGKAVNTEGVYPVALKTPEGCDSLIDINLKFAPVLTHSINAVVCKGKPYILPDGKAVTTEGAYPIALKTPEGCDSFVVTILSYTPALMRTVDVEICRGKTYILPDGKIVKIEGNYPINLKSGDGCDSLVETHLKLNETYVQSINASFCKGNTYKLPNDSLVLRAGSYPVLLKSRKGCDSLITTILTLNAASLNAEDDKTIFTNDLILLKINTLENDKIDVTKNYNFSILKQPHWGSLSPLSKGQYEYTLIKAGLKTDTFLYKICYNDCPNNCDSAQVFVSIQKEAAINETTSKGIIPNGHEANRMLRFSELDDPNRFPLSELVIVNRWGQVVFKESPYHNDWAGDNQNNQELPAGTYYYILRLNINEGKVKKGDVTIIR